MYTCTMNVNITVLTLCLSQSVCWSVQSNHCVVNKYLSKKILFFFHTYTDVCFLFCCVCFLSPLRRSVFVVCECLCLCLCVCCVWCCVWCCVCLLCVCTCRTTSTSTSSRCQSMMSMCRSILLSHSQALLWCKLMIVLPRKLSGCACIA